MSRATVAPQKRKRKLRYHRTEVRFAEDLPPGTYWAIYSWKPFGMGEWITLQRERPTVDGKARVTPGAIVGPRRQIEDVVVLPEKGRVRRALPHERRAVGDLAVVV